MKSYFFYTDQLTVGYDGRPLIKEINIQLNKGEILTLIGPNGAGKSTILKSITRQLSLISGTVYLEQEQMSRMTNKEVSRKLAVVLTERMRPELMTCEDVVSTGRYPYTGTLGILSPEDKKKVKNAMEMVHAWDLKNRDFSAVSDGQRQRRDEMKAVIGKALPGIHRFCGAILIQVNAVTNGIHTTDVIDPLHMLRRIGAARTLCQGNIFNPLLPKPFCHGFYHQRMGCHLSLIHI